MWWISWFIVGCLVHFGVTMWFLLNNQNFQPGVDLDACDAMKDAALLACGKLRFPSYVPCFGAAYAAYAACCALL